MKVKKFLTNLTHVFQASRLAHKAAHEYDALTSTQDYLNPKYYEKIERSVERSLAAYREAFGEIQPNNPYCQPVVFIQQDVQYIKAFAQNDYKKSFEIAYEMYHAMSKWNNPSYKNKAAIHALDSLMQIKTSVSMEEYDKHFWPHEKVFKNRVYSCIEQATPSIEYRSGLIALAYVAYLEGNDEETNKLVSQHSGVKQLQYLHAKQTPQKQPWFQNASGVQYGNFMQRCFNSPGKPTMKI